MPPIRTLRVLIIGSGSPHYPLSMLGLFLLQVQKKFAGAEITADILR